MSAPNVDWPDEALLPQVKLGPRLGGAKELATHTMFYVQLPMALVNWSVGYYATPLHTMLPLWLWYGLVPVLFTAAAAFHYVVVHKSWVAFTTGQGADEEANPQYSRMVDDHEELVARLDRIAARLDAEHDGGDGA